MTFITRLRESRSLPISASSGGSSSISPDRPAAPPPALDGPPIDAVAAAMIPALRPTSERTAIRSRPTCLRPSGRRSRRNRWRSCARRRRSGASRSAQACRRRRAAPRSEAPSRRRRPPASRRRFPCRNRPARPCPRRRWCKLSGGLRLDRVMFDVNFALTGPILARIDAVSSVSECISIDSQPGMHWPRTSGSLSAAQTRSRSAGIRNSPVMSIAVS